MSEIVKLIEKIEDKVWRSGCGYLYDHYDELVRLLNATGKENLTREEIGSLRGLVNRYAYESTYDNSSSVNWIQYSVRAFYCADSLVGYLPEINHEFFYGLLNGCFLELLEAYDDREFEMTLFSMAAIPFKQKVKDVLEHYANCDDRVVSEMASVLLESYKA